MKRIVWCLAIVAAIAVAGSSAARADMVYNFGSPDQAGGDWVSTTSKVWTSAQSFEFTEADTTFNEVTFWAFTSTGAPPSATVNYEIYTGNSAAPGTLAVSGRANVTLNPTGNTVGAGGPPEYTVTFDITAFTASKNTTYWLALNMPGPYGIWEWSNGTAGSGLSIGNGSVEEGGGPWTGTANPHAFELASVPLPSALLFFAPGLAGLAFLRKRFKG